MTAPTIVVFCPSCGSEDEVELSTPTPTMPNCEDCEMTMEPKPEEKVELDAPPLALEFEREGLHYRAERFESDNEPPEGGECHSYLVRVGRSALGAMSGDSTGSFVAPCWASVDLSADALVDWLFTQAKEAGIAPADDEETDEPPPCPKCKSDSTFDTGFEKFVGEVAIAKCSDCDHEFMVNIARKATFCGIYDAGLPG